MNSAIVRAGFEFVGVTLPLTAIHPIRQIKPTDHAWGKYRAVLASIREVGVIEPLIVHPQKGTKDAYFLLDGHMRLITLEQADSAMRRRAKLGASIPLRQERGGVNSPATVPVRVAPLHGRGKVVSLCDIHHAL